MSVMSAEQQVAQARAEKLCEALLNWSIYNVKDDGTITFEIDESKTFTLVEFAPEHWLAFEALMADANAHCPNCDGDHL